MTKEELHEKVYDALENEFGEEECKGHINGHSMDYYDIAKFIVEDILSKEEFQNIL